MPSIPFSTFVDVTSATLTPSATFGRLNALCITASDVFTKNAFEEFTNVQDIIERYGVNSPQAKYATEFFGYSSKSATKPQKLTFYNWLSNGSPLRIKGGAIDNIESIKVDGVFRTKLGDTIKYTSCNLTSVVNFVDAAKAISAALKSTYPSIDINVVYENNMFNVTVPTNENFEFLLDDQETFELFNGNIDSAGATIEPPITIVEAGTFILNTEQITSTITGANTLKVKINDNIEIFNESVNNVKDNPLMSQQKTTIRSEAEMLQCSDISVEPEGYTFENTTIQFTQNDTKDLSTLCKLTSATGATISPQQDPISIKDAINSICINNGDYVTIGFDSESNKVVNLIESISDIMSIINAYKINRYYFIGLFSDSDIEALKTEDNTIKWSDIQTYEGLIAIRGSNPQLIAFTQAIIASIDYSTANGAININFIDASQFTDDAITTTSQLSQANKDRVNTAYITGGYGQQLTFFGEGHIMGDTFKTLSIALGETWLKAQMEVSGINILNGSNLISLRGKSGQGQIINMFSDILNAGVNSGIIVAGATLTSTEKSIVAQATGLVDIYSQLENVGWYLVIDELTDEDIANKTLPVTYVYVANVPVNRIQVRSFIIGA